jgi:hypothetical protein
VQDWHLVFPRRKENLQPPSLNAPDCYHYIEVLSESLHEVLVDNWSFRSDLGSETRGNHFVKSKLGCIREILQLFRP